MASGLAWQAALKMTGKKLELLTDPDLLLFIEKGLRGGIAIIFKRYAKDNDPYLDDYDPHQPLNYLLYSDANNLFEWAMSQPLLTHDFCWLIADAMKFSTSISLYTFCWRGRRLCLWSGSEISCRVAWPTQWLFFSSWILQNWAFDALPPIRKSFWLSLTWKKALL